MIEASRRRSPAPTGSAMRRLMTRPIQAHLAGTAQPGSVVAPLPASAPEPEDDNAASDLARLRLEVAMMKAALAAERRESEALRASLGLAEPAALGEEARAVRERWAILVERLIHASP
ncbi:hypothetical protein [Methylorubrum zatmanii]|nr:hypothetical protein [Methylorubrum zatmanii]MBD8905151.1 hypothetical protein [Methylorubrum zatmanii]